MTIRTFSYGGGVQSTAALVLAAQGKIDYKIFLFANVGADSENPDTLRYIEEIAKPYAVEQGIELVELSLDISIHEHVVSDRRSIVIPVRMSNGAPGNRQCTDRWKRKQIARWQRQHGATKDDPSVCGLGISMDEIQRMRTDSNIPTQTLEYPLIDLRLTRQDCRNIIADAGLLVPPKSACWFCPFQKHSQWLEMRRNKPELFERAVALEKRINEKRDVLGKDVVYLHPSLFPLDEAVGLQHSLFEDDPCDSGFCFV